MDLTSVLDQPRSLNLIPFADYSRENLNELIYNFAVFIPFGLLISVNFKRPSFWRKFIYILIFSLSAEIIQLIFAIGIADITDVISNTSGGLVGLALYSLGERYIKNEKLDNFIVVNCAILITSFTLFLGILFSHGVKFNASPSDRLNRMRNMTPPKLER